MTDARSGLWAWALWLGLCAGCSRGKTAESACLALRDAVLEADGTAVYDSLLQSTQWSISTVYKLHAQMAEAIATSYPGKEQPAALARLYAADADNGRDLFWQLYPERYAADFRERVGEQMPVMQVSDREARCGAEASKPFALAVGQDGKWGLSELDREWEDAKLRAYHDLETVQQNVELYRRMGASK